MREKMKIRKSTRRRNHVEIKTDKVSIIDLDKHISEISGSEIKKHRSCWLHTVACIHGKKKRITRKDLDGFKQFEHSSPCFLQTLVTHQRSKRGPELLENTAIVKQKKLDSKQFQIYLERIWSGFAGDKRNSCTYIDCLWFHLYLTSHLKEKVLSWITKRHVFSKKYVFVPIVCWDHWSLLILCHFGEGSGSKGRTPCMLLLDSMAMTEPRRLEPNIRKFIFDIYQAESRTEDKRSISKNPLLVPKVPQQRDGEKCGNFVLYYMNLFLECAPENFSIAGYPYFMVKNWFSEAGLESFFKKLDT